MKTSDMEARIPFSGFYDSIWSEGVDNEQERWAENKAEELQVSEAEINEILWRHTKYRYAHLHIAQEYVPCFENQLNDALDLKLSLKYKDMTSPREYNFETDRIFVEVSYKDMLLLARRVGRKALRRMAKKMFTSCDGFSSFYDPDVSTWGPLRTWDHNQLYCLFEAAVFVMDYEDYECAIYEGMSESEVFISAFDEAMDYETSMVEIGKLVGAKEALEEQDDGKRFPVAFYDTKDYVKKYEKMNPGLIS